MTLNNSLKMINDQSRGRLVSYLMKILVKLARKIMRIMKFQKN